MTLSEKFPSIINAAGSEKIRDIISSVQVIDVDEEKPANIDPANTILIAKERSNADVFDFLSQTGAQHFVQSSRSDHLVEVLTSALMLKLPQMFLTGEKSFLLSKVMKNVGRETRSKSMKFRDSKKKPVLLNEIEEFVYENPTTRKYLRRIIHIADEMIMNALYDAPINKKGEHIFSQMDRTDYVEYYTKAHPAKINVYHDNTRLIIGCEDPWGSLEIAPLVRKMHQVFAESALVDTENATGAGLGIRAMVENSTSFYALVKPGELTMIYCNFEFRISNRKMETMPKHIHLHRIEPD